MPTDRWGNELGPGTPRKQGPYNSVEEAQQKAIYLMNQPYTRDVQLEKRGHKYYVAYKHTGYAKQY